MNRKQKTALILAALSLMPFAQIAAQDDSNVKLALNMYSNQRARQVGDLLTITISEVTSSSKSESLSTSKTANAEADAPVFGTAIDSGNWLARFNNKIVNASENMPLSSYSINASSSFNGSGKTASSEALTASFTVRVVDILDNGVLVVRGERKIIMRNEDVNMVITGLVRVKDISSANTVPSSKLADAHIYYETGGETSRGSRPGYAWRIFQYLNPF